MSGRGVAVEQEAPAPAVVGPAHLPSGAEPARPRTAMQALPLGDDHHSSCGDGSLVDARVRSLEARAADCMGKAEGQLSCFQQGEGHGGEDTAIGSNWQALQKPAYATRIWKVGL